MKTFLNHDVSKELRDLFKRDSERYPEESTFTYIKNNMVNWRLGDGKPLISIVILTKDNLSYLRPCLCSIERFSEQWDVEIIIVSNCVKSNTKKYLDACGYDVYYLQDEFSFAAYNNFGVSKARGKYVVLLNDDTLVTPKWLDEPIRILESDEQIGVCGVKVLDGSGKLQHMGISVNQPGDFVATHMYAGENPDIPQATVNRFVKAVSGVCMIAPKGVYFDLGGLNEEYGRGYYEDLDFCLRMERDTDYKVLYVSDSVIYHFGSVTFSRENIHIDAYSKALNKFRETWVGEVENSSYRFKSSEYIYGSHRRKMIIRNPNLAVTGGGEALTFSLAQSFKHDFDVEIQSFQLNESIINSLRGRLGADFSGINIDTISEGKFCDVFINLEFGSSFASQNANRSIYYAMFPQQCGSNNYFLASYDKIVSISKFTQKYVWDYWRRYSDVIYPASNQIHEFIVSDKKPMILNVGRFFRGGHTKQQKSLLKAFKALNPHGWELVLAGACAGGDMDYVESLRDYIKLYDLNAKVLVNISREELWELYSKAYIYWHGTGLGSKDSVAQEHFGITVVEAMSAGCVPMVFNSGGPVEIVKNVCGEYIWDNINDLCSKTTDVFNRLENTNYREDITDKLHKRASDFAQEKFAEQWKKVIFNQQEDFG